MVEAYEVQRELHACLAKAGRSVVGTKIGCTTPVMQEYLRIGNPCAGGIYDESLWRASSAEPARVPLSRFRRVGLECELAVVLSKQLGPGPVSLDEAAAAVGSSHAAIELVDDRYEAFAERNPKPPVWLADDFFHAGEVLGPALSVAGLGPAELAMRLNAAHGAMRVDGELVGEGTGADIIEGHPLNALAWLASDPSAAPDGLAEGWVVSLGSVTKTHWVEAPEAGGEVAVRADFRLGGSADAEAAELENGAVSLVFEA